MRAQRIDTSRRLVPSDLAPSADRAAPPVAAGPEVRWLQPIPDAMLDPATIVEARDSLRIALIATLQHLPGRQRAVLILRDVLGWPASHVVATSNAAVKSTLQRARARLKEEPPDLFEPAGSTLGGSA